MQKYSDRNPPYQEWVLVTGEGTGVTMNEHRGFLEATEMLFIVVVVVTTQSYTLVQRLSEPTVYELYLNRPDSKHLWKS